MANGPRPYMDRIVRDPAIMAGKPVVKGTRIPVERVIAHLAEPPDLDDLFAAFPHLTLDDVKACLAYAHARLVDRRTTARRVRSERRSPRASRAIAGYERGEPSRLPLA